MRLPAQGLFFTLFVLGLGHVQIWRRVTSSSRQQGLIGRWARLARMALFFPAQASPATKGPRVAVLQDQGYPTMDPAGQGGSRSTSYGGAQAGPIFGIACASKSNLDKAVFCFSRFFLWSFDLLAQAIPKWFCLRKQVKSQQGFFWLFAIFFVLI